MKIIAIDLVELFNFTMCNITQEYLKYISTDRNIGIDILRKEILQTLYNFNKIGFKRNIQYILIDSCTPHLSINVDKTKLGNNYLLGYPILVDNSFRQYIKESMNLSMFTHSEVCHLYNQILKNIKFNNIHIVSMSTNSKICYKFIKSASPINIETLNLPSITKILISPYDMYDSIEFISNESIDNFLKTEANLVISKILN